MALDRPLRILQVNTFDVAGGAERVAWNLFTSYREMGHQSRLTVGHRKSCDPGVMELSYQPKRFSFHAAFSACESGLAPLAGRVRGAWRLHRLCDELKRGWQVPFELMLGREDFHFPGSRELLRMTDNFPDIVHGHNLHKNYFDLRILPELCRRVPVILTLHDAWLLSGHCAHSFDCARWQTGCGECPDLSIYPSVRRDSTASNWRRKREIFAQSRLYIATPSDWLLQRVEASMLAPAVIEARVIPNGVDLATFRPAQDCDAVRNRLGIDSASRIVVFAANGIRGNMFKDYGTFRAAIAKLGARWSGSPLRFLAVGEGGPPETIGLARLEFVPFSQDGAHIAQYLQAADVYVHAARADTFPNTVIEALACGTPVVASAVGGIPEQIENNITGFLVAAGDSTDMANRIELLLRKDDLRRKMGAAAGARARQRFDLKHQAETYLNWYRSILESHSRKRSF